ncbi:wax ester/triacylglycerol synthase family O-acyltransferase [Mycobacterium sp. GA-2829]|uniref:wax ester/triacylglycerol synthase family O-acyltransferase n=1 Tax=Mycobacterium sp. GA-2829 TaxID=1772283 RepID=UPI00074021F9|nr:wax ester/triacylglycerol synthase family O-acyltransferase [Mycobacterium sp. GA-2829]KUI29209.1 hypothetical protein AU194_20225 [Mycobacterium sp. GA-2829]
MERLSGLDAGFLAMETANAQMHTLKLAVFGRDDGQPVDTEWFTSMLTERITLVPCYTQRIVRTPLGLHRPILVHDPTFDPRQNVHVIKVEAPGGRRQRDEAIARVCGSALRRDRPLWEVWLFEGLAHGELGCLLKLHHALADGRVAANQIRVFSDPSTKPPARSTSHGSPGRSVIASALLDRAETMSGIPRLIRDTARSGRTTRNIRRDSTVSPPGLLAGGPRTRFRRRMDAQRTFGTISVPLAEIIATAKDHRVTVNDVLLAAVGGAVRTYLIRRGELPRRSLTTGIPVDTSTAADTGALRGNKWAYLVTTLATDIGDPAARLQQIHRTTAVAKTLHAARGDLLERWWECVPMSLVRSVASLGSRLGVLRLAPLPTLGVSNVRGPSDQVEIGPACVRQFYSVGPLMDGVGLNVTAWSVAGHFHIALCSAINIVEDPEELLDALHHELRVLRDPADEPHRTLAAVSSPRQSA